MNAVKSFEAASII